MDDTLATLINDAKLAADQDSKIFALNQVCEMNIVLNYRNEHNSIGNAGQRVDFASKPCLA